MTDFIYNLPQRGNVIYDIETFPNFFCCNFHVVETGLRFTVTDLTELRLFAAISTRMGCTWIGFNNLGFDYPVIHSILLYNSNTPSEIYHKAMAIIDTPFNQRFSNMIWESDTMVKQIDLYKIHHFDNHARATSLKVLETRMCMNDVRPLPFTVGTPLNVSQQKTLVDYCWHDIDATLKFYHETADMLAFRVSLSAQYGMNMLNYSDAKIGAAIFTHELDKAGLPTKGSTERDTIRLADCILPYIYFKRPEFNAILNQIAAKTITELKGAFTNAQCTIDEIQFVFGTGGLHASRDNTHYQATNDYVIQLADVVSYYPSLSIANEIYPAHLGPEFCNIYKRMFNERKRYAKGTPENAAYKLALNSSFGNFGNKYSNLHDNLTLCKITIAGQLSLAMLCEWLMGIESLTIFNVNTDGIAYHCHKSQLPFVNIMLRQWEKLTSLTLETEHYKEFFNRDCNNYLAIGLDDKLKSKGAYAYADLGWHQNHSSLIVQKSAEAFLLNGTPIETTVRSHPDLFDFLLVSKTPKASIVRYGPDKIIDNINRYYVSTDGDVLTEQRKLKGIAGQYKRANKLTDEYYNSVLAEIGPNIWDERIHTKNQKVWEEGSRVEVQAGYTVLLANHLDGSPLRNINYDWYIKKANKLIEVFK